MVTQPSQSPQVLTVERENLKDPLLVFLRLLRWRGLLGHRTLSDDRAPHHVVMSARRRCFRGGVVWVSHHFSSFGGGVALDFGGGGWTGTGPEPGAMPLVMSASCALFSSDLVAIGTTCCRFVTLHSYPEYVVGEG